MILKQGTKDESILWAKNWSETVSEVREKQCSFSLLCWFVQYSGVCVQEGLVTVLHASKGLAPLVWGRVTDGCVSNTCTQTRRHTGLYTHAQACTLKKQNKNTMQTICVHTHTHTLFNQTKKAKCKNRPQEGRVRTGARLKTSIEMSLVKLFQRETMGVSVPASLGLNTDEPAQIQPRVTTKFKYVAGTMQRGCGLATAHSQG